MTQSLGGRPPPMATRLPSSKIGMSRDRPSRQLRSEWVGATRDSVDKAACGQVHQSQRVHDPV